MDVQIVTHEVRLQKWTDIVKTCRSSGKTIKKWCADNDIDIKRYYYWQRKVYLQTCREMETVQKSIHTTFPCDETPVFAEINLPKNNAGNIAVSIHRDTMQVNVYSGADAATVETVFASLRQL